MEAFQPEKHLEKLKQQLVKDYSGEYGDWKYRVAVFVRKVNRDRFKESLPLDISERVDVFVLEECVFPWNYWKRVVGPDRSWDRPGT